MLSEKEMQEFLNYKKQKRENKKGKYYFFKLFYLFFCILFIGSIVFIFTYDTKENIILKEIRKTEINSSNIVSFFSLKNLESLNNIKNHFIEAMHSKEEFENINKEKEKHPLQFIIFYDLRKRFYLPKYISYFYAFLIFHKIQYFNKQE